MLHSYPLRRAVKGEHSTLATNAEAGATLLRQGSYYADALRTLIPSLSMSAFEGKADPEALPWDNVQTLMI